jgi:hypothetical protein
MYEKSKKGVRLDNDILLSTLISMVEKGVETSITLSVRGTILCGDLISERGYFEGTAQMVTSNQPDNAEFFQKLFSDLPGMLDRVAMERMDEGEEPEDAREDRERMATSFIHLKNTQVLSSSGEFIDMQGGYWRCKVLAVDGYWLGRPR